MGRPRNSFNSTKNHFRASRYQYCTSCFIWNTTSIIFVYIVVLGWFLVLKHYFCPDALDISVDISGISSLRKKYYCIGNVKQWFSGSVNIDTREHNVTTVFCQLNSDQQVTRYNVRWDSRFPLRILVLPFFTICIMYVLGNLHASFVCPWIFTSMPLIFHNDIKLPLHQSLMVIFI